MEFAVIALRMSLSKIVRRTTVVLLLSTSVAFAQSLELSAEQRQMLNQLPPAQRQQAIDAIRDLRVQQSTARQESINEPLNQSDSKEIEQTIDQLSTIAEETSAQARSRLIVNFTPSNSLSDAQLQIIAEDPALQKLIGSHLYVLDDSGILVLQGLEVIPLLGLTETDINRRLSAEPYLSLFDIDARILSQKPIGIEALEPFGYDVFLPRDTSFDTPTSGPVPPDYVLGPGDTVRVQLFGNVNGIYEYEVSRDGILNLPEVGPVTVAGISFSEFRSDLNKRVQATLIGTQVSVTMGQLRTIRVFVLGDVNRPGSHVVGGLETISGALYRGGGVSEIGTLRGIQLKRNGRIISTFDAYDLLIRGDSSGDRRLQPGDVIFVPSVGSTVRVGGAVKRPAIYETKGKASVADIVELAGGLTPDAFVEDARLERIDGDRKTLAVNLSDADDSSLAVQSGDMLMVPVVLPSLKETVTLSGHVFRPGNHEWRPGMRLTDIIRSPDLLKPGVDTGYVLIRREKERGQPIRVVSANLGAALKSPGSDEDILLETADTVYVFSLALGRQRVVGPLLDELRIQATYDTPAREVHISGDVRAPGVYPLETQMRVSDLIRAGGSLSEAAYATAAELTRYSVVGGEGRETEVIKVDLAAIRGGDKSADLVLREHDYLIVNRTPEWDITWTVALEGEVLFPGRYRVRRGETLGAVVRRAGGLTENAYPEGAVFLRKTLKEQEGEQIDKLARRLEADLATLSLQAAADGGAETLATGKVLLSQLRETEPVGRLVVDMKVEPNGSIGPAAGIEMRDGDRLLIPTRPQVVTVLGETQQNTSHVYRSYKTRDDYINQSGGLTRRADRKLIYVVRANGQVIAGRRSRWLGRSNDVDIRPGDTIVVPLDTDRMRPLTFWTNVTQILYQGAIAVAAVRTFNN